MRLDWFEYGRKSRPDLLKKNERMQSFAIYLSMFPTTNFSDTAIHDLEKFGNRRRGPFCIFDQIKRWKFLITTEYYKGSPLFSVTIMAGERGKYFLGEDKITWGGRRWRLSSSSFSSFAFKLDRSCCINAISAWSVFTCKSWASSAKNTKIFFQFTRC